MKRQSNVQHFKVLALLMIFICASFYSTTTYANSAINCEVAKQDFKLIYLQLQAQFLNYEGKDTVLDDKGNITLVDHKAGAPYEGKLFEEAVFKEYQNSLRKVGRLFQEAKFGQNKDELLSSSPGLVDFLRAIESEDPSEYIISKNINDVVDELHKASQQKFANGNDAKFALTNNDKYLLKKLLTHAQDRICSVSAFERTGKRTHYFDTEYLKQLRNAPLNRIIRLFKDVDLNEDSEILVNDQVAISSAMSEHLKKLSDWMKKNEACRKYINSPHFIQANVQYCNYNRFLDSLAEKNFDALESVLHFINANEKFLDLPQAKAETDLNELYLESMIDRAFDQLGRKINCSIVEGENNQRKIFVRNLPYNNGKHDTSSIECKVDSKPLSDTECSSKIKLVSDELGRGVEIQKQDEKDAKLTFSIKGNPNCSDLALGGNNPPQLNNDDNKKTEDQCRKEGEAKDPKEDLVPSDDGKSCIPRPKADEPKNDGQVACEEKNQKWVDEENDGRPGIKWEWDGKECVDKKPAKDKATPKRQTNTAPPRMDFPSEQGGVPPRFTPIQVPTRQMYILPGMP